MEEDAERGPDDAAYRLPELVSAYDALNGDRRDFAFHIAEIGAAPARVLDVGCGTGTLAIALARLGHRVHATDPSRPMIDAARRKPGAAAVSWHVGSVEAVPDGAVFDRIVMTGHAFQCLLTDAEIDRLFGFARARLAPHGRFCFETRNPEARAWESWTPARASPPVPLERGGTVQLIHDVISAVGEVVTFRETFRFQPCGEKMVSVSSLRFAGRKTIIRLAAAQGLGIHAAYGDWDRAESGPELIFVLSPEGMP